MTQQPPDRKPKPAERVHPDDRGRIAAFNMASQAIQSLQGSAAQGKPPTSYYTPLLIQCTLPHSDPKTPYWVKTNGEFTLKVSSGIDKAGIPYRVPYGSFPRLTLAYIITHVVKTSERRIELSSNFGGFLKAIGYTGNHKGTGAKGQRIREQLMRLLNGNIAFEIAQGSDEAGQMVSGKLDVADTFAL